MVLIGATGTSTCPVRAMRKYLGEHHSGPLFTLTSGKFLTRRNVSDVTKSLLSMAGIDPTSYSSHSYRIGAATSAAAAGLSDHLVKTLGRWRSSAYQGYIRTSPQVQQLRSPEPTELHTDPCLAGNLGNLGGSYY